MKTLTRLLAALFLLAAAPLHAQYYISADLLQTSSELKLTVLDSLSQKPVAYTSVFLVPQGDSTITNFTMTDTLGVATLSKVTRGSYLLNINQMGYNTIQREIYVRDDANLGKFYLQEDRRMLQSATVTGYVDPITIVKDTITYNAVAFGATESEMLGDLLKRMPGMEVDNNGNVSVNGQSVNKITVEGRTFFFDDKKTALNNLPAKIVDKIRVIDKESDQAQLTGIADVEKEKVMDLELKAEFKKGFFGNLSAKGGTTMGSGDDEFRDDRGLLYIGNAMLAAYGEKSQLTVIGNASNVNDPSAAVVIIMSEDGEYTSPISGGLNTSRSIGANLNTQALDGYTIDGTLSLSSNTRDAAQHSLRTTNIQTSGDLFTETTSSSTDSKDAFTMQMEMRDNGGKKISLIFRPSLSLNWSDAEYKSHSEISNADGDLSTTENSRFNSSNGWNTGGELSIGFKDLGKKGRTLTLNTNASVTGGGSTELSNATYSAAENISLLYTGSRSGRSIYGSLIYNEPLPRNLSLSATLSSNYSGSEQIKDASNLFSSYLDTGGDNIYSSRQNVRDIFGRGRLMLQWRTSESMIQASAEAAMSKQVTESQSRGISTTTGDEWTLAINPRLNVRHETQNTTIGGTYTGNLQNPSRSSMLPVPNVSNATSISVGNVYLRRPYRQNISLFAYNYDRSDISIDVTGNVTSREIVSASWFDGDGIRYAVPVNSEDPSYSTSVYFSLSQPIDKQHRLSVELNMYPSLTSGTSYQATGILPGIDLEGFDYSSFMSSFWGNGEQGQRFYSGASGFRKSRTRTLSGYINTAMMFRAEKLYTSLGYTVRTVISRYSLNPAANNQTWSHALSAYLSYRFPNALTFTSRGSYTIYRGYRDGFNQPVPSLNASIEKSVKAFTFSLTMQDIFNSTRSISHNSSENWYEDSNSLVLSRYFLAGVKWNFGKMNESNSSRARSAAFNMMQL